MKIFAQLCVCFAALFFCSGCATPALWSDHNLHRYAPAKPPNLELLQNQQGGMILVTYDESLDESAKTTRRAYWINPEVEPSSAEPRPRPVFVSLRQAKGLLPLPISTAPEVKGYSAVTATNEVAFTLYSDGQKLWRYELPKYERRTVTGKQIALTPLAVAADATIVGGAIAAAAAYGYAGGRVNSAPSSETK